MKRLPREAQDAIFEHSEAHLLPETRAMILEKYGIECRWDAQISEFRGWCKRRQLMERRDQLCAEALGQYAAVPGSDAIRRYYSDRMMVEADIASMPDLALRIAHMQIADESLRMRHKIEERKLALREQELALERERFQWSAAEAALKCLDALRAISTDGGLTNDQRIEAARKKLFGIVSE